jgi:hypothetical protein
MATFAATVSAPTWREFYSRHKQDGGAFEDLFKSDLATMAAKTETHLNDTGALTDSIVGSAYANMVIVPGANGKVHLLHHGFGCNTSEGFALIFIQGNLVDSSSIKVLPREEAVSQVIGEKRGRRGATPASCPDLGSMVGVDTAEAFGNLPEEGNEILQGKPNHVMVTPEVYHIAGGAKTVKATELAFRIIEWLQPEEDDDDEVINLKEIEAQGAELLLAMLWATANKGTTSVALQDTPDDPRINVTIRSIKDKVLQGTTDRMEAPAYLGGNAGISHEGAEALALTSQSMILALNRLQESQDEEKARKESEGSLLKTMGPAQRELFTSLCRTDMAEQPVMSEFMKTLTKLKSPQKAIGLLKAEMREWKGTFSDGGCHRFLSNGFLSSDTNRANPGGFTVFMFFPKAVDGGGKAFDGDTAKLRDYFGMKVEDSTIAYYAKQGFFSPENPNDLHTQLQTAFRILELLTCKGSIASAGLAYILDPERWDSMTSMMEDRFRVESNFGARFCYAIDRPLQVFFAKMTKWRDVATEGNSDYLLGKAQSLVEAVDEGLQITVVLPKVLTAARKSDPSSNGAGVPAGKPSPGSPAKKLKTGKATGGTPSSTTKIGSTPHVNANAFAEWLSPEGSDFMGFFPGRMPGLLDWPRFEDKRLSIRNPKARPAPMCVRFQATGKCSMGCSLSHVSINDMGTAERERVAKMFKKAYESGPL